MTYHIEKHEKIESATQKDESVETLTSQVEFAQEENLSCYENEQNANDDSFEDFERLEYSFSSSNSDEYSDSSETESENGEV